MKNTVAICTYITLAYEKKHTLHIPKKIVFTLQVESVKVPCVIHFAQLKERR